MRYPVIAWAIIVDHTVMEVRIEERDGERRRASSESLLLI
jgi:hypothetical protein